MSESAKTLVSAPQSLIGKKSIMFPFALLVFLAFISCQSFNSIIKDPKASFKSVDIAGVNLRGVDLIARVNIENPNGFSIPMPDIDWELFINKNSFTQGLVKNDNKTIAKNGITTIDVPISVNYEKLYGTFTSLLNKLGQKETTYDLAMKLNFAIPVIENIVYRLDYTGVLPLP
jgi:LEA14-like dessication related protein